MESMTGYAFLEKNSEQYSYSIEIKSLNAKYLEVYVNLPKILKHEENDYIQILKKNFQRGKIELSIDIFDWNSTKPVSLNLDLIQKYYHELEQLYKKLKINDPVKIESLLSLEGITQRERTILSEKSKKDMLNSLDKVISKVIEMRKKEGTSIKKDIILNLSLINRNCLKIKSLTKNVLEDKKKNLKVRLEEISGGALDNNRIFGEIALLADKLDINEELVRLNDHIEKFKIMLKLNGQLGRKFDFLAQELFREINTIASKSNNSEISHLSVDIKNYIDKIREHCRNIV
jgi:uncharacterized protein (TIGR00255 family)